MPIQTDQQLRDYIDWAYSSAGDSNKYLSHLFSGGKELLRKYSGTDPITGYNGMKVDIRNLHFYYFMISPTGMISHKEFSSPLSDGWTDGDVGKKVAAWIGGANAAGQNTNSDLNLLEWHEPCVVAFAVNLASWKFFKDDHRSAIQFPSGISEGTKYHDNQTFHNARFISVDVADEQGEPGETRETQVLLVNNRHLLPNGSGPRPKGAPDDHYKFDLYFRVDLDKGASKIEALTVIVDPGGRNLGP